MDKTYTYESANGYKGKLNKMELTVREVATGKLKFHTYASTCHTEKDLKDFVDDFPNFLTWFADMSGEGK